MSILGNKIKISIQVDMRNWVVFCPNCELKFIRVKQVWCGCKPIPRKLKKYYKKLQRAYGV